MKIFNTQSLATFYAKNTKSRTSLTPTIKPQKNYKGYSKKNSAKNFRCVKSKIKSYKKFFRLYYLYKKSYNDFENSSVKFRLKLNKGLLEKREKNLKQLYKVLKTPKTLTHGILRVFYKKRNIFLVLSDPFGKTYTSTSSGTLVKKKKKFIPSYVVKDTARKMISKLFLLKLPQLRKIVLMFKGRQHRKTKTALLEPFQKHKKLKVLALIKSSFRSHNGCRPPKIRRK
jgi:ribosomal protein S11